MSERYHHGSLREALLREGERALGEPDFSIRMLARRIGVSPNAPYRHFADLGALLDAIAVEGFHRLTEHAKGVEASDPTDRLIEIGERYVGFAKEHPALFRLMFRGPVESVERTSAGALAFDEILRPCSALVPVERGVQGVYALGRRIWAAIHGAAMLAIDMPFEQGETSERQAADLVRLILKGYESVD